MLLKWMVALMDFHASWIYDVPVMGISKSTQEAGVALSHTFH